MSSYPSARVAGTCSVSRARVPTPSCLNHPATLPSACIRRSFGRVQFASVIISVCHCQLLARCPGFSSLLISSFVNSGPKYDFSRTNIGLFKDLIPDMIGCANSAAGVSAAGWIKISLRVCSGKSSRLQDCSWHSHRQRKFVDPVLLWT